MSERILKPTASYKETRVVAVYDSVYSFAHKVDTEYMHRRHDHKSGTASTEPAADFNGHMTYSDAIKFAMKGGYSGADQAIAEAYGELLADMQVTNGIDLRLDVAGSDIDMAQYLSGEPENMWEIIPQESARLLTLVLPVQASYGVAAEALNQRGVAVAALLQVLRQQGYTLDLWYRMGVASGNDHREALVRVSDSRTPEADDVVTFALGHAAAFRRIGFAWMEGFDAATRRFTQAAYGAPIRRELYGEALDVISEGGTREVVQLPMVTRQDNGKTWHHHYATARQELMQAIGVEV